MLFVLCLLLNFKLSVTLFAAKIKGPIYLAPLSSFRNSQMKRPRAISLRTVAELDCYVLDDETRVVSSGSTTKAIANVERGSLQDYIGQKALNPFIDKDKVLQETIKFSIPGTQWVAIELRPRINPFCSTSQNIS